MTNRNVWSFKGIKPNFEKKIKFACWDIESAKKYDEIKSQDMQRDVHYEEALMVGVYSIEHGYKCFNGPNCIIEFLEYITLKYKKYVLLAHNAAKYDNRLLLAGIVESKFIPKVCVFDNQIYSVEIEKIKFIDSCKIIPGSLKDLAKSFNSSTLKGEMDVSHLTHQDFIDKKEELTLYNKDDCIALYNIVQKLQNIIVEKFGIDPLKKLTIGSLFFLENQ